MQEYPLHSKRLRDGPTKDMVAEWGATSPNHRSKLVKSTQLRYVSNVVSLLCLAFSVASFSGCKQRNEPQRDEKGFGSIVGANYTSNGIETFTVDGAWGGNIMPFSGGGVSYVAQPIQRSGPRPSRFLFSGGGRMVESPMGSGELSRWSE